MRAFWLVGRGLLAGEERVAYGDGEFGSGGEREEVAGALLVDVGDVHWDGLGEERGDGGTEHGEVVGGEHGDEVDGGEVGVLDGVADEEDADFEGGFGGHCGTGLLVGVWNGELVALRCVSELLVRMVLIYMASG